MQCFSDKEGKNKLLGPQSVRISCGFFNKPVSSPGNVMPCLRGRMQPNNAKVSCTGSGTYSININFLLRSLGQASKTHAYGPPPICPSLPRVRQARLPLSSQPATPAGREALPWPHQPPCPLPSWLSGPLPEAGAVDF